MSKKILLSLMTIGTVVAITVGATNAYFSDTETSLKNQFTAGVIDLEIDSDGDTIFSAQDDQLPVIFEYLPVGDGGPDIKPGDGGEVTLSLHLKADSNNADLWMQVLTLVDDGGLNPESEIVGDDVISDDITVLLWLDEGTTPGWQGKTTDLEEGDNIKQAEETTVLHTGTIASLAGACKLPIMDNAVACTTYYVGFSWELPTSVGNEYQGDYCTFDIKFGADQIGMMP